MRSVANIPVERPRSSTFALPRPIWINVQSFWRDPSGGWRYHLRAWRAQRRWEAFRRDLELFVSPWLRAQARARRRVILVGASGGYTLPWSTLHEIPDKCFVEPDPLARLALRKRDPQAQIDPRPGLGWSPRGYSAQALQSWLGQHRGDALLFCNLLGQLDEGQTLAAPEWRSCLIEHLSQHAWLSYHDLLSASLVPRLEELVTNSPSQRTNGPSPILDRSFWRKLYPSRETPIEVVDHGTARFFAKSALQPDAHQYFAWPLDSTRWHLIEGLASATPGRGRADSAVLRREGE